MSATGTITTTGVGSGLDIEGLVSKLVAAEGQSKQVALATREASVQSQISAYGSFKSALSQLQAAVAALKDGSAFRARSATVGDKSIFAATASGTAAPGSYDVEVVSLAASAKLRSGAFANSATGIGTGTLTLSLGARSFSIEIGAANNTLAGIRDAINASGDNPGISASLVTANDGVRLVLTSAATGAANAIKVTQAGGDGGLASLVYDPGGGVTALTQLQAATDARILVDGNAFDSATNSVTGAIDGVTIDLLKTTAADTPNRLTVAPDASKPQTTVVGFVSAYNTTMATLRKLNAYDAATKTGGVLIGDPVLRGFLGNLRQLVGSSVTGLGANSFQSLSEIGVTTNLDGSLKVDNDKLAAALGRNADGVARLFGNDGAGIAKRMDAMLQSYTTTGGLIEARTKGLEGSLQDLARRQQQLQRSLATYELRLRAQFTAMDTLVAQLKQTGQNLVSQLNSISTGT